MTLEVGAKFRSDAEIVFVSEDKRLIGVYHRFDMGDKGRIWGKMFVQDLNADEREEFFNLRIQIRQINGVWYQLLESVKDYAQIFSRCNWYVSNRASAFSQPEPMIV